MKKASAVLMALSLLLLSGCRWFRQEAEEPYTAFFDETFLAECKLDDLPTPPTDEMRCYGDILYFNLSDEAFETYADTVIAYLLTKEDIYYPSYYYETGNPGGIFYLVEDRYKPLTADADLDCYYFAFSTTEQLNEGDEYNNHYWNGISIDVKRSEGERGSFAYNAVVVIDNDPRPMTYETE